MAGKIQVRAVTIIFVVAGIIELLPYPLSFFLDGLRTSPAGLVGGVGTIAMAVWFARGSNIARYLLFASSVIGVLACGLILVSSAEDYDGLVDAILVGSIFVFCYCLWVLMLSTQARLELSRRRDAITKQESDRRREFYKRLGEPSAPSSTD
jgi:hypothetical protein